MIRDYEGQKQIEEAIKFLIEAINKSGRNPKPVILHSLRVAFYLDNLECGKDTVTAAVLHDTLEDTDVTVEDINKRFGKKVSDLVAANSFKENIAQEQERYKETFQRCVAAGREALVIKAADILENSNYYNGDEELLEKMKYFINISEPYIKNERVWQDLVNNFDGRNS